MYPRHLHPLVRDMLGEFRIVYLTGPRQSGKTTLARSVAAEVGLRYLTLDDPATQAAAASDPHGFVRSLGNQPVVLDEFQHVPELVPALKEASDRHASELPSRQAPGIPRKGLFLLTGSADIFRSARVQEALPGHMARLELLPLSVAELQGSRQNLIDYLLAGDFSSPPSPSSVPDPTASPTREQIARLILLGGYPEVQSMSPRARSIWFRSYTEGRFFKDFESLYTARGDYHSKLRALAPYLAGRSANLLRYASLANDLELNDKLAKSYVEILELMFLIRRVPSYRKNLARRMAVRMPKLHFVDTGLASPPSGPARRRPATHEPALRRASGDPALHGMRQTRRVGGGGGRTVPLSGQAQARGRHRAGATRRAHHRCRGGTCQRFWGHEAHGFREVFPEGRIHRPNPYPLR